MFKGQKRFREREDVKYFGKPVYSLRFVDSLVSRVSLFAEVFTPFSSFAEVCHELLDSTVALRNTIYVKILHDLRVTDLGGHFKFMILRLFFRKRLKLLAFSFIQQDKRSSSHCLFFLPFL